MSTGVTTALTTGVTTALTTGVTTALTAGMSTGMSAAGSAGVAAGSGGSAGSVALLTTGLLAPGLLAPGLLATGLLTAGLGVALLEGGGPQPALEGVLVAPPGDDQVAVEALRRAQQLEGLEAVDLLDLTGPGREALLEDLAPALGDLEHVDLDDGHPLHLRSVGPRA
jgi:hypothetical protein